jgi:hypothetical protein
MFWENYESFEPGQYCYQLIAPRQLTCFSDQFGNDTCALAIEEEYNCGASGGSMLIYKCGRSKANGRTYCLIDDVTDGGAGSGIADLTKMKAVMQASVFSELSDLEPKYVAHAGSFQDELTAYRHGRAAILGIDRPSDPNINPRVAKVYVLGAIWYRLLLTWPTTFESATKVCDEYKSKGGGECSAAATTLSKTHIELQR